MLPEREDIANLVVCDDDEVTLDMLCDHLAADRFGVMPAPSASDALRLCRYNHPDLLLLDLSLPDASGLDVLREIREADGIGNRFDPRLPVIVLTGRSSDHDRVRGLDSGADDYVCKPFSVRELVARVRAILRRGRGPLSAAGLVIDEAAHRAQLDGRALDLTPVEFRLLCALASAPGRVFARERLLERLYEDHRVVTDRTVDAHVKNLRRKLEEIRPGEELVRSIYGVGYKLEL